ncbi:ABC transporter ATP-binding protein [Paenibacillus sp.]|uniref:ABC transporter ATP-binding protein n=1 Tax=Paenibacillus sp. TaxID=58172 RepID=UPI002D2D0E7A|nr:ABC transporter ATP-binding protein [Paenibacillus sp.]HZG57627.1 ABC transporter ATP-binding protein [Paenibacillus sp.]
MGNAAEIETPANKLELRSIAKTYRIGGQTADVLHGIDLTVRDREFVSVVGPSGSGKSTLFYMIGGLTEPSAGSVWLDGRDVTGERGLISYMPQHDGLFPWRSILDNVVLSQEIAGRSKAAARRDAREWLQRVGLGGYEEALPHQLSGGMRQRASFLRALLSPRDLMCLDEPFGALDALTRLEMQQWLLRIWEDNRRSVLFVTHSIEEALLLSDRVYVLAGRPATVADVVDVPFGRPRDEAVTSDSAFLSLKKRIYETLRAGSGRG